MTALRLSGLTKAWPGAAAPVLAGLDLGVEPGRLTALVGPSGSGKTTVLKLVAGLLAPDAGDIRLGGRSLLGLPPERRRVVMVFQAPQLFAHLTVAQNVGFGLRMRGLPPARIAALTEAMLDRVQLAGFGARLPAGLSGGQAQRVALARALVLEPEVLLLDEPLSSLDASLRDEMRTLIRDLQRATGVTTLMVTHDQTEAVVLADRIALLLDGRVAQHATPEEIYRRPASLRVARFFGGVNFLPGHAADGVFHSAIGPLPIAPGQAGGPGLLTIRPEAILLGAGPLQASVLGCSFLGPQTRVTLDLAGTLLLAMVAPEAARGLVPGQVIAATLPPAALWVIPETAAPPPAPGP